MIVHRTAIAIVLAAFVCDGARADQLPLQTGLYKIGFSLELPHLEKYAVDQTAAICIRHAKRPGSMPLPVLSGNGAFTGCSVKNMQQVGSIYSYDVTCSGRGVARATAIYKLMPGRFRGRVMIVLGAKNMTMTEVQDGHRIGSCDLAGDWRD